MKKKAVSGLQRESNARLMPGSVDIRSNPLRYRFNHIPDILRKSEEPGKPIA